MLLPLTKALLKWGENRFTKADKDLVAKVETKRYRQLLRNHCSLPNYKHYNGVIESPWGKHTPAKYRGHVQSFQPEHLGVEIEDVLPVVMVKDPFNWMHRYVQIYCVHVVYRQGIMYILLSYTD